jgi:hypothetical protein
MARLAEMYSAVNEARAIEQDLKACMVAGVEINRNSGIWHRLASNRWNNAMIDLSEHLTTHRFRPALCLTAPN